MADQIEATALNSSPLERLRTELLTALKAMA
jgi:hypothetical protein